MRRQRRLEVLLAISIVVVGALYARAAYIPPHAEQQVEATAEKLNLELGEPSKWFSAWSVGDGQAFAVIAADPSGVKLGEEIKEPAYRFSRAGYGWLAAGASLGNEAWVPYGLAIAGLVALVGTLLLALRLRDRLGPKVWLLILNPALYLGFAGDTAEPLAILFLAMAMTSGSIWAAAALGVTRPSYLVALTGRWRPLAGGLVAAVILALYSLFRFGLEGFSTDGGRLGLPFAAYVENPSLTGWLVGALAVATVVMGIKGRDWAWVLSGLLVVCLGSDVTADPINAWRAAGMLPVLWTFGLGWMASVSLNQTSPATDRPLSAL